MPYVIERYNFEAWRHWNIVDAHLATQSHMVGNSYSLVDMALWGWAHAAQLGQPGLGSQVWGARPNTAKCADKMRYAYNVLKEPIMHKRMTITLDEVVYDGLYRTIGKRRMSQFIEDLLRPHVLDTSLDDGYRAMAADAVREAQAQEWSNALARDMNSEAR
jgi:hypothetical protein